MVAELSTVNLYVSTTLVKASGRLFRVRPRERGAGHANLGPDAVVGIQPNRTTVPPRHAP